MQKGLFKTIMLKLITESFQLVFELLGVNETQNLQLFFHTSTKYEVAFLYSNI